MKTKFICKCNCGGNVRCVRQFGRLFSYCIRCTPTTRIKFTKSGTLKLPAKEK